MNWPRVPLIQDFRLMLLARTLAPVTDVLE